MKHTLEKGGERQTMGETFGSFKAAWDVYGKFLFLCVFHFFFSVNINLNALTVKNLSGY